MLLPLALIVFAVLAVIVVATSPKVGRLFHAWRQRQRYGPGGY